MKLLLTHVKNLFIYFWKEVVQVECVRRPAINMCGHPYYIIQESSNLNTLEKIEGSYVEWYKLCVILLYE